MASGVTTVFNNDTDNTAGQGTGTDSEYTETKEGKEIKFCPVNARYMRIWSRGSTKSINNHIVEVEVYSFDVVGTHYYDAFGNILEKTGDADNSITYAGYQYDEETDLYYLNARMYDPKIARFLQEDTYTGTADDPLSLNLYTYCHNEPIMYVDPIGHWREALGYLKELVDVQLEYKSVLENTLMSKTEKEKRFKELHAKANKIRDNIKYDSAEYVDNYGSDESGYAQDILEPIISKKSYDIGTPLETTKSVLNTIQELADTASNEKSTLDAVQIGVTTAAAIPVAYVAVEGVAVGAAAVSSGINQLTIRAYLKVSGTLGAVGNQIQRAWNWITGGNESTKEGVTTVIEQGVNSIDQGVSNGEQIIGIAEEVVNVIPSNNPNVVTLGLHTEGYIQFAQEYGLSTVDDFAPPGNPMLDEIIDSAIKNSEQIVFKLDNFDFTRAQEIIKPEGGINWTNYEFSEIVNNLSYLAKTIFVENGEVVSTQKVISEAIKVGGIIK